MAFIERACRGYVYVGQAYSATFVENRREQDTETGVIQWLLQSVKVFVKSLDI